MIHYKEHYIEHLMKKCVEMGAPKSLKTALFPVFQVLPGNCFAIVISNETGVFGTLMSSHTPAVWV